MGPKKTTAKSSFFGNARSDYPNRADEVRSRRAQRSKERISSVSSRVVNPRPSRPVVVRGSAFGRPIHQQAGTRARRQFYVTVDRAAGTEMRLPAIPLLNPGWRLASGILAILVIFGIVSMWNSPFCMINAVEVTGVQRLSVDEISAVINLENLSIVEVDPGLVKEKLASKYPELINIRVRVDLPNAVSVSAEERVPVLAIEKGDQTDWVDASGYIFPARGEVDSLVTIDAEDGLPLALVLPEKTESGQQEAGSSKKDPASSTSTPDAAPISQVVDPTTLNALLELSQMLPQETKLAYSKEHGLGWKSPEGWQIFIGTDLQQFKDKYSMYQQLTKYMSKEGVNPVLVNVEHLNAPYYRLEQ
jgi:hypothetical protein